MKIDRGKMLVWSAIGLTGFLVMMAFFKFVVMPYELKQFETKLRAEIDVDSWENISVAVVSNAEKKGISKHTLLDSDLIKDNIVMQEIPEKFAIENPVESIEQLEGMILTNTIRFNGQISLDDVLLAEEWFEDFEREKEISVRNMVADKVQKGNLIDLVVNYDDGTYDVILSKVKVKDIFNPYETVVTDEEGNRTTTVVNPALREGDMDYKIILDLDMETESMDYLKIRLASELGHLDAFKYIDDTQPATEVTFDITEAYARLLEIDPEYDASGRVFTKIAPPIESEPEDSEMISSEETEEVTSEPEKRQVDASSNETIEE